MHDARGLAEVNGKKAWEVIAVNVGDSRSVLHASGFTVSSETETVYTSWFWYSLRWPPHPFITDERGLAATAASSVEKRPSWPTALSASKRWSRRC